MKSRGDYNDRLGPKKEILASQDSWRQGHVLCLDIRSTATLMVVLGGFPILFVIACKELIMDIRFQPALLQEVIDSFAEKTEREGDPTYYNEFHEVADPIYEKFSLDDREP